MADGAGTPALSVPTALGVAQRGASCSRILPNSAGKIAHARIIKGERSPERAQYFFELMKERVT
jgi:hypothetical protein